MDGSDRSRISERDSGACEIFDRESAIACLLDQNLILRVELGEVEQLATLDRGDEELARTIWLCKVDCDAEIDVFWVAERWLAVDFGVEGIHLWHRAQRLDHGETDEMGEGDLAATCTLQVIVDHGAVVDQKFRGDRSDGCRSRH